MQSVARIRELTVRRIDVQRRSPGIVVGALSPEGSRVFAYGDAGGGRAVADDTVFEIASMTKGFTGLLLAMGALRGEVALDDPIDGYLPKGVKAPTWRGRQITLRHLATHSSGLPSQLPGSPYPTDVAAWSAYTRADLLANLERMELTQDVGVHWTYSNTGYALLGIGLERATGRSYEALLRERILDPLHMNSTAITLPSTLAARRATPHLPNHAPTDALDFPVFAAAGGIWSTAGDMLRFISAAVRADTPLSPAFAAAFEPQAPTPGPGVRHGLGWAIMGEPDRVLIGVNGGALGMASSAYLDPSEGTGVVVLSNSIAMTSPFAVNLIRPEFPGDDRPAFDHRPFVQLTAAQIERWIGRYEFAPGSVCEIIREGSWLVLKATTGQLLWLAAASPTAFYSNDVDLSLDFDATEAGPPSGLMLHYGGRDTPARRVSGV